MAGHVYLIGSRIFNWYKIGKSSNAAIRVSELGILLPFRIEVLAVWKANNHHELERLMHKKHAASRINGEWFNFNPMQVNSILMEMRDAQVTVAENFSNIGEHSVTTAEIYANRGKVQKRIDQLTAEKAAFQKSAGKGAAKRIDKLTKQKNAAELRVAELESLLKSLNVEEFCNPRQPQGLPE